MPFSAAHPVLRRALDERGYTQPTPVQVAVLQSGLEGRDLLVSAATGSGKTVGFGLAMAPSLIEGERAKIGLPGALVVAPTRELAQQVAAELRWLYAPAGGRVAVAVGGTDMRTQLRALHDGTTIVVGTPGRLCDLMDRGSLKLAELGTVVLDEADEMLDMGFREELERLLDAAPKARRTMMFSATLPESILKMAARYQKDAHRVAVNSADSKADIAYHAMIVAPQERENAVVNVLRSVEAPGALVFVATRDAVHHMLARLIERGFHATSLSGELSQQERNRSLQAFRDGRARVLVATDVAARGLDVADLGLVIHADLPNDAEVLVHRSGRTGRAGRKGMAVLLVPMPRRRLAYNLLKAAKVNAHWGPPPTAEEILVKDQERLAVALAPDGEASEEDLALARTLLAAHNPEQLVASLVRGHRERNPAPEDLPATTRLHAEMAGRRAEGPPGERFQREDRGEVMGDRRSRGPDVEGIWFRIDVGRRDNAQPQWLVPLICRRGAVDRRAIGRIHVMEAESHFEVHPTVVAAFEAAARRPDKRDPHIRIQRVRVIDGHRRG